jgi:hypothetical protein
MINYLPENLMEQEKRNNFGTIQMPTVCSAFLFHNKWTVPSLYYEGTFS